MLNKDFFESKKGQVASGMSWMVATLVIIAILSASIFAASLMSKTRAVSYSDLDRTEDVVMVNSIIGHYALEDSGVQQRIYDLMSSKFSEGDYYSDFNEDFNELNRLVGS